MDINFTTPAPLLSAGLLLAKNKIYSMAWLDADFNVTACFGELAPGLEAGEPLYAGLPFLADYEDEIRSLPHDGRSSFELPGIMLKGTGGKSAPRIDIVVFRHRETDFNASGASTAAGTLTHRDGGKNRFLLLVTRAGAQSMDLAIARMLRERQMLREDIEQKNLELDRVNTELELSNRDLEDFATIISHDLKAPMRAMRYLADDIEIALNTDKPDSAKDACSDLKVQSRRMSTMLSQLLDYASVGHHPDSLEQCDTRALIDQIIASLPRPVGMAIIIEGEWPIVETFVAPLDLVARNLIDNAIKHHDHPDASEIHIAATPSADTLKIVISDDGPGIPTARQEAVFHPFRSFSNDAADGGNSAPTSILAQGMGLAFVKRTVEIVGGSISLKSDPTQGRGSAFLVTWPLSRSDGRNIP